MSNKRDDFNSKTKEILAQRVAFKCSNPDCRKPTIGPNSEETKVTRIGIAAHICAAAPGGPRYDKNMTKKERENISNGIWLCSDCAKLIDVDVNKYTVHLIQTWKKIAEELAVAEMISDSMTSSVTDKNILEFYAICFNRSAFRDPIRCEGNIEEDFKKAIEDTLTALNTGVLRSRDGMDIKSSPQFNISNSKWREKMHAITCMLEALLRKLEIAIKEKRFIQRPDGFYYFNGSDGRDLEYWFDSTRAEIIDTLISICSEAGINIDRFPKYNRYRS